MAFSRRVASFLVLLGVVVHQQFTSALSDRSPLRGLAIVDSGTGFISPHSLPVAGSCKAGKKYTITSIRSLFDNGRDLECIFAAGLPADNIPLGYNYGHIIAIANTAAYSKFVQIVYQGDYVVKTQCGGNNYNIGWLSIAGFDVGTAVWRLGKLPWELAKGEYPLGDKQSIIMDFTVDFNKICAAEGNESPIGLKGFSPFKNSIFPLNQFIDVGRVVGVDSDGGVITLNKALIYAEGLGAHTALIYAIKSFDPSLKPGFTRGTAIEVPRGPNNEVVIKYGRQGAEGLLLRVFSILTNPVEIARQVAKRDAEHRAMAINELRIAGDMNPLNPFNIAAAFARAAIGAGL